MFGIPFFQCNLSCIDVIIYLFFHFEIPYCPTGPRYTELQNKHSVTNSNGSILNDCNNTILSSGLSSMNFQKNLDSAFSDRSCTAV